MKNIAFVLILVSGLAFTISAQTERARRVETSPAPKISPQPSDDNRDNSNSNPRQSQLPPFLGGSVCSTNNKNTVNQTRPTLISSQTSAPIRVNKPEQKKPSVLISSPNSPIKPAQPKASSVPATTGSAASDDDEVIKVETQLVTIPVTVLDRQGRFMIGLQQADFKISENGNLQEIAYFNTTEQAFTVVLLIDVSNSTKFKIDEIQTAAISFIDQLKPNDRVMIISFDDKVNVLSEPTSNRRRLYDAVRRANFDGGTSLYDAVDFAINRRLNQIEGRKAIVLFTDGVDTTSRTASYRGTLRDSEELDATVYPVYYNTYNAMQDSGGGGNYPRRNPYPRRGGGGGLGSIIGIILGGGNVQIGSGGGSTSGTTRADYERGEQYLEDLAAKTGGRKYDADSTRNLTAAFSSVAEELRRQYSIGYYPTDTGQTGEHKQIKVSVARPDSIVRSRDSYIVGEQKPLSGN